MVKVNTISVAGGALADTLVPRFVDQTLRQMPSLFGRLVYAASFWDPDAECYRHYPLCRLGSLEAVGEALELIHLSVFHQWLALNLRQQRADVARYVELDGADPYGTLRVWYDRGLLDHLSPVSAGRHECQLFREDLAFVVASLRDDLTAGRVA